MKQIITIIILILYVIIVSWIGYANRKSNNNEDYFLASRSLPPWILSITFIASWWGGGSAIDLVDHAYSNGLSSFWIYGVPVLLATFFMFLFAAVIRRISYITQPEIVENKYGKIPALMLSVFILIFMILGAAVQVVVIGKLFHSLLGIGYFNSAVYGTLAVVIYSFFGGFRGVVLTDVFQFVFFLIAALYLFYFVYTESGGFDIMFQFSREREMIGYTSFFHGVMDNMAYVITFGLAWMVQANVWQRISASRTPGDARKMMIISFFVFIPLYLLVTFTGMLCMPLFDSVPSEGLVPAIINQINSPVIQVILFVGLCSAIMSTMDSLINTGALTVSVDIYERYFKSSEKYSQVTIGRVSTLLIAAIALFMGLKIQSVLKISWIGGDYIVSGAFVPLVAAIIWEKLSYMLLLWELTFLLLGKWLLLNRQLLEYLFHYLFLL